MPLHSEGNQIYKELDALKDVAMKEAKYQKFYPDTKFNNGTLEEVSLCAIYSTDLTE